MEPERDEVYERIPWETLEKKGSDRQWLLYAVAGAVVLGALVYSFMRNQPVSMPPTTVAAVATSVPAITPTTVMPAPVPSTVVTPMVVAEADLYAVDPERLVDQAAAHAEWFAVEFVSYDGSEQSSRTLAGLLPGGVPLPEAPAGAQVFVDWAGAGAVTQTGPMTFDVDVMIRSLVSTGDGGFQRQPPRSLSVTVEIDEANGARVIGIPTMETVEPVAGTGLALTELPADVMASLDPSLGEPIGGIATPDGDWQVVVMEEGTDGVLRPLALAP
ncbi:MAG TPA: hypothetical protein VFT85_05865 [Acidimicrobiia bacterium]|nr:hypothetical protein [Acidimicrobiia bacterium]